MTIWVFDLRKTGLYSNSTKLGILAPASDMVKSEGGPVMEVFEVDLEHLKQVGMRQQLNLMVQLLRSLISFSWFFMIFLILGN